MARQNRPVFRVAASTTFSLNPFVFPTDSYNHVVTQSTNIPHLHSVNIAAPWLSAETLTSHGSDHLSVVFNLQIPSKEPPSRMKGRGKVLCQNCANGNQRKARKPRGKARSSHHSGTVRRESLDRKTCRSEKLAEGRTLPNPDPTLKAASDTKTERFEQIAREAKEAKWKGFCEELSAKQRSHSSGNYTEKGNDRTEIIPDLEDTNECK